MGYIINGYQIHTDVDESFLYIPKVRSSLLNSNNRQPDVYKIKRVENA